ncbi:GIN domain-containing protein [Flagellimonas sp.]|uniref:GIN domain-containing protein n=1 Tax=Flagellimonas sp. TaxID=2058762 RepID=UPI003B50354E
MKKIALLLLLLCHITAMAQRKPKIKGSRVVTEVSDELPAFNAIQLNDDLDIVLKKSFGSGYEIIADDNLIDILKFRVEDSTLVISSFYDVTAKKQFDITINFTELKAITLKKGSMTVADAISADELFVDTFENTRLNLKASAAVMDINMEGVSKGDFNVDVDSLNVSLSNRAEAFIYTVNEVGLVELDENGMLTLEGTSDRIQANLSGNSRFKGQTIETGSFNINIENTASARVYAFRDLELRAKGNTKTYLYGNPKITILEFLDTAQLIKKVE